MRGAGDSEAPPSRGQRRVPPGMGAPPDRDDRISSRAARTTRSRHPPASRRAPGAVTGGGEALRVMGEIRGSVMDRITPAKGAFYVIQSWGSW